MDIVYDKMDKFKNKVKKIMDNINTKAKAKTGMDINFAAIFLGIILFIILIFVVKGILGWVGSSLMG